ncbi:hypothetical protein BC835DRAFT_1421514 [Cytidiella melzeri]|nr:hypothetical protein BC835DRAFT_1421514 [Cytidiella melzeri]
MPTNKSKYSAHPLRNKPKASDAAPAAKKRRSKASHSAPAPKRPRLPQSPDSSDDDAGGQNSNVESESESENDVPMEDLAPKERVMAIHAALITDRGNDPVLKRLVSKARWLPRIAGMVSDNMDDIFSFGAKVGGGMIEEGSQVWKELKAGSATSEGRVVWRVANQWNALVKVMPEFVTDLKYYVKSEECFRLLLAFMVKHASAARRDDIAGLKGSIHNYIISEEPIPAGTPKNQLGWGNITTARLLVPQHMRVAFDRNPTSNVMELLQRGDVWEEGYHEKYLAKNLPSFLWDDDEGSDCEMFDEGLLRGPLLLKIFRHLFTGKSSAVQPNFASASVGRSRLIKVHKVRRVEPGMIAWAAVMARFSLSSVSTWKIKDGAFSLQDMWDTIIRLFDSDLELGDPEWARDTLRWWNREIFGPEYDEESEDEDQAPTFMDMIEEQRRIRREVREQQATQAEAATKEARRRKAQAHDEALSQAEDGFEPEATPPRYNSVSQGGEEDSEDAFGLLQVYGDIADQADFETDSVSAGSGSDSEHSDNSGDEKEYGDGWP